MPIGYHRRYVGTYATTGSINCLYVFKFVLQYYYNIALFFFFLSLPFLRGTAATSAIDNYYDNNILLSYTLKYLLNLIKTVYPFFAVLYLNTNIFCMSAVWYYILIIKRHKNRLVVTRLTSLTLEQDSCIILIYCHFKFDFTWNWMCLL